MNSIDPSRYLLPDTSSQRIFDTQIVPDHLSGLEPAQAPRVVFIAGQPGAGKTMTTRAVAATFTSRGGATVINTDYYKPYHPLYHQLLRVDDRTAAAYTSLDGRRWAGLVLRWATAHRVNMVIETTIRSPAYFRETALALRAAGYRTETAVLAVPAPLSRLGILARYHQQVRASGHGRLTDMASHDASYAGVLAGVRVIDEERLVDVVAVYRRGNVLLYANDLDLSGDWNQPPGAAAMLAHERSRIWTPQEARIFLDDYRRLRAELDETLQPQLRKAAQLAARNLPRPPKRAGQDPPPVAGQDNDQGAAANAGSTRCRVCNRPLTDPESLRLGVGPSCRAHPPGR